jgi:hypothetical protein
MHNRETQHKMSVPMDVDPSCHNAWFVGCCNYEVKIGINALYKANSEEKLILNKMVNHKGLFKEALPTITPKF